jgi:hypothetical protein
LPSSGMLLPGVKSMPSRAAAPASIRRVPNSSPNLLRRRD